MTDARTFFTEEEKLKIIHTIRDAELKTSGEIKIHIDDECKGDVLQKAQQVFIKLKLHKTALQNGLLIYIAVKDHQFALVADEGINKQVPPHFWEDVIEVMQENFKADKYLSGVLSAIEMAGNKLIQNFPVAVNDINEISNEISFE